MDIANLEAMTKFMRFITLGVNGFALLLGLGAVSAHAADPDPRLPTHAELVRGECGRSLSPKELEKVYLTDRYQNSVTHPQYTINAPRRPVSRNQCAMTSCWAEALAELWQVRAEKAFGEGVRISASQILRERIAEKALVPGAGNRDMLVRISEPSMADANASINSHGLVTAEAVRPRFGFDHWPAVLRRMELDLNTVINYYLALGQPEKLKSEIDKVLNEYFPPTPPEFKFAERSYSPNSFRDEIVHRSGAPTRMVEIQKSVMGLDGFLFAITRHIEKYHEPVLFAFEWDAAFYDAVNATLSVESFIKPMAVGMPPIPPQSVFDLAGQMSGRTPHAVLVTDFARNARNEVTALLLLNSNGKNAGDGGYLHLLRDYLQVSRLMALVDESVLSP